MKKSLSFIIPAIAFLLFVVTIFVFSKRSDSKQTEGELIVLGKDLNGDSISVNISDSNELIIAFINTTCDVCSHEIPDLYKVSSDLKIDLVFLSTEDHRVLNESMPKEGLNKNISIISISDITAQKFRLQSYPQFLFFKKGKIINEHSGKINATRYVSKIFR